MKWPTHGANPHYLYKGLQIPIPEKYIDFSMNVNPFGMPDCIRENWSKWLSVVSDYPDPQKQSITKKIAKKNSVPIDCLLVGNGGAELISIVGKMFHQKRVVIVQPAFSEYEIACRVNECKVFNHHLQEGDWQLSPEQLIHFLDDVGAEALFLCTPNNPTGVVYREEDVLKIVRACHQRQITVVIDEAFYDFYSMQQSYIKYLHHYPNLIILRSLTKMYAIAGLRLGYAIAHPEVMKVISSYQPHWSVNGVALQAGEICLDEFEYVETTVRFICKERARLFCFLKENQFAVSASQVNFYLLRDVLRVDQLPLFRFLLKKGIVPRHTANFPGLDGRWLRFAIKQPDENDSLMEALIEWRTQS